jgi:twitching motility protein PilT
MTTTPTPPDAGDDNALSGKLREPVTLPPLGFKYQLPELLALAVQHGASDLHLRVAEPPMFRVDGKMIRSEGPPVKSKDAFDLIAAFTSEEDIRIVQENGQADFAVAFDKQRFRANVFRASGEWGAVLRRIPENIPTLQEIIAPPVFYSFTRLPRGLVLVTGPTGSGKTTTLAAMINQINFERPDVHILTLEDPIEFKHPRKHAVVTQRELGTDFRTFADGLRAALREDPDIIMLGEMRDTETMEVAMTAAETGHLVFSTVHTVGAKDTVDRIITAFPHNYQDNIRSQLASILRGVISQVLLPHASGRGRVAAFEIMVGTSAIANLIRENNTHQIPSFLQTQRKDGMRTLDQSLSERYAEEIIRRDVAMERAQEPCELENLLRTVDEKRHRL